MKKRVLALLVAAAMCASLCVGCGSSKADDSSAKTTSEAASETTSETAAEAQAEEAESMDLTQVLNDAVAAHDEQFPDNPIKDGLFMDAGEEEIEEQYPGISDIAKKQMVFAQSYITGAPPEFMLVEVENAEDVDAVKAILQARVDDRSQDDPDYPDNSAAWKNNAKVTSKGNYVFLEVMFDQDETPEALVLE